MDSLAHGAALAGGLLTLESLLLGVEVETTTRTPLDLCSSDDFHWWKLGWHCIVIVIGLFTLQTRFDSPTHFALDQ